ncbi:N-acetylmuramoyl-L-alanine amidase [Gammaproteobacteria bacterium]
MTSPPAPPQKPITRSVTMLVIHCSASPNGAPHTVQDIDRWHHARGFERSLSWRSKWNPDLAAIGYHYIIYTDGTVHTGRHRDENGAHVQYHNSYTLGICLIGTDKFTPAQWSALADLVRDERHFYRRVNRITPLVQGHREFQGVAKECPGFSVFDWLTGNMVPLADHLLMD